VSSKPRRLGPDAERRVRLHFRLRGYRILAANAWAGGNELDLVVRRGERVVVCEVKAKSGDGFGDPLEMVTEEKTRRVRRAAEAWLAAHPELAACEVSLEAVAVRGRKIERVPF
jgi:putative endonuclease